MTTLVASNLHKDYRGRHVVNGISLDVSAGEVVGLLGPNGAGKTTCFYLIVGLIPCQEGQILLNDTDVTDEPMHVRAQMGLSYLAQEPSIFRKLTVYDNVMAVLETRPKLSRADRKTRCMELLEELGIARLADSLSLSLSGGERRRLEIARALAVDPSLILLDEPFAGVDPIAINDIKSIVSLLSKQGIGILITDHNVRETLDICHRAYIINRGEVIAAGDPKSVLEDEQVREVYLGTRFSM